MVGSSLHPSLDGEDQDEKWSMHTDPEVAAQYDPTPSVEVNKVGSYELG